MPANESKVLPAGTALYRCPPRNAADPLAASANGECGPGIYTSTSPAIAMHYPLRALLTLRTTRALTLLDRSTAAGEMRFQATGMRDYDGIYYNRFGDEEVVLRDAGSLS